MQRERRLGKEQGSEYPRDRVRVRGADGDRGHAVHTVGGYAFDKFDADIARGRVEEYRDEQPQVYAVCGGNKSGVRRERIDTVVLPEYQRGRGDSAVLGGAVLCDAGTARGYA